VTNLLAGDRTNLKILASCELFLHASNGGSKSRDCNTPKLKRYRENAF